MFNYFEIYNFLNTGVTKWMCKNNSYVSFALFLWAFWNIFMSILKWWECQILNINPFIRKNFFYARLRWFLTCEKNG